MEPSLSPSSSGSLITFSAVILAAVAWITIIKVLLPRVLGFALSFFANRLAGDVQIRISSFYIYPLAGRALIDSVKCISPNFVVDIEQVDLRFRWWRRVQKLPLRQLLNVDHPRNLDPLATEQARIQKENDSSFLKRQWYRFKRWYRRTSVVSDPNDAIEPPALISLTTYGLRLRLVNAKRRYDHVAQVLALAKKAARSKQPTSSQQIQFDPRAFSSNQLSIDNIASIDDNTSSNSDSSTSSVNEKPFLQEILGLSSFRIVDGSFYFCDMGQSPLVRVTVDSVKLRYRYGAAACPADEYRKRFRMRIANLKVSTADQKSVQKVTKGVSSKQKKQASWATKLQAPTDKLIKRIVSMGHVGFDNPKTHTSRSKLSSGISDKRKTRLRDQTLPISFWGFRRSESKQDARHMRKPQQIKYSDILKSSTTIVDYVFDEPGMKIDDKRKTKRKKKDKTTAPPIEGDVDEDSELPAPVSKVSVLLRESCLTYDANAFHNLDTVIERLEPALYDLLPLSRRLISDEGRREATVIQIEVEATPIPKSDGGPHESIEYEPLVRVPFLPRVSTWKTLQALNIRKWKDSSSSQHGSDVEGISKGLPLSFLVVHTRKLTFKTEVPHNSGVPQRISVLLSRFKGSCEGVANIPIGNAKTMSITRDVFHPRQWNGLRKVKNDVVVTDTEFFYLPDTTRLLTDVQATLEEFSKKAPSVNFFIPFQETLRIEATEKYRIVVSCSHENSWNNISNGHADEYGHIVVSGENVALALSPNIPVGFYSDTIITSWTLNMPNATGKFVLPIPCANGNMTESQSQAQSTAQATSKSSSYKGMSYLSKRSRSQLQIRSETQESRNSHRSEWDQQIEIDFLRVGGLFELSGKVLFNENRMYLDAKEPAFLDSVNRTDISLKASSLILDLNPHHVTNILNMTRIYAGQGIHTLTVKEKERLKSRRKEIAKEILASGRYPTANECTILGLGAGPALLSSKEKRVIDDILHLTFQIDSVLIRLHDLPHSLSAFDFKSRDICSIQCQMLQGKLSSNRLGLELSCTPDPSNNVVVLYEGVLTSKGDEASLQRSFDVLLNNKEIPCARFEDIHVTKQTLANHDWGPYHSELQITMNRASGCVLDTTAACLARMATKFTPDPVFDDQIAVAALLSVDNINIHLNEADWLVISPSITSVAETLKKRNRLEITAGERQESTENLGTYIPKYLSAVSEIRLPNGFRVCMSNLAQEKTGTQTRVLIPNISVAMLMNTSGKVTPWVDLNTTQAHVAHVLARKRDVLSGFDDGHEALRQVVELQDLSLDLVFDYKPLIWSPKVPQLQASHISNLSMRTRHENFPWCFPRGILGITNSSQLPLSEETREEWWNFLHHGSRASILLKYLQGKSFSEKRFDAMSLTAAPDPSIIVAPEFLRFVMHLAERGKCLESEAKETIASAETRDFFVGQYSSSFSSQLLKLWQVFESHVLQDKISQTTCPSKESLRGLQTGMIRIVLLHPSIPLDSNDDSIYTQPRVPNENIAIVVPYGLHLFQSDRVLLASESSNNVQAKHRHTKLVHASLPSLQVVCGDVSLAQVSNIVFIQRQTENRSKLKQTTSEGTSSAKEDIQVTTFSRIGSCRIGYDDGSLYRYERFCKVIAILMLMIRTVNIQIRFFRKQRSENIETVCRKVFGTSLNTFLSGDREEVRALLTTSASPGSIIHSDNQDADIPGENLDIVRMRLRRKKRGISQDSTTSLIDFKLQDVSLKISDEEILTIDSFACKGGSTNNEKSLDGIVLNAVGGTISLFIRDDIIASSLDTVASVASYVRKATLATPMLRHDGSKPREQTAVASNMLSFRYGDERFADEVLSSSHQSRDRSQRKKRRQIGLQRLASRTRSKNRGSGTTGFRLNQFQINRSSTSSRDDGKGMISLPQWAQNLQLRSPRRIQREESELLRSPQSAMSLPVLPAQSSTAHVRISESMMENEGPSSPTGQPTAYISNHLTGDPESDESEEAQPSGEGSFIYVAVRTAGDSGPPRKRSKSMVRISPVVPPGFQRLNSSVRTGESENVVRKLFGTGEKEISYQVNTNDEHKFSKSSHVRVDSQSTSSMDKTSQQRNSDAQDSKAKVQRKIPVSVFVSFQKILCQYHRGSIFPSRKRTAPPQEADILFLINDPRVTLMSAPSKKNHSLVFTTSSAELTSSKDPECVLHGSIQRIGLTVSLAPGYHGTTLPKFIASVRLTEFKSTLHAKDLQAVLRFREEFKKDLKGVLSAFVKTQHSISEMTRATRLSSAPILYSGPTLLTSMSFDLLCDNSRLALTGFHPRDSEISVYYSVQGLYFSIFASESENAALTLGLRIYGHGLSLTSPLWVEEEKLHFPSIDARGVQWGETVGLPTILKVSAGPLINSTSMQGLRHILFTVSGLLAFQNVETDKVDEEIRRSSDETPKLISQGFKREDSTDPGTAGGTPFSRTMAAWERTKGARMDISIRPMSLSLASGQVAALFEVGKITGTLEWNKLVKSGVQLHAAVCLPSISLTCFRMASSNFKVSEITPDREHASLSVRLDRPRVDILKVQEDLKHVFTFRVSVFKVHGQLRPWRLLLDAACWADGQELVSELQSINYRSLSATNNKQVLGKNIVSEKENKSIQHREMVFGVNVKGFSLAVPLLNAEIRSPRLTFSGTEVHLYGRQSHSPVHPPSKNLFQLSIDFVGIFWDKSTILSSRFAKGTLAIEQPTTNTSTHLGALTVVIVPGTWNVRPKGDVVHAILQAKHSDENKEDVSKARHLRESTPEPRGRGRSISRENSQNRQMSNRMLIESLQFKVLRTSGLIEGIESEQGDVQKPKELNSNVNVPAFSVSIVRHPKINFDLMDIDFSGGEGHFPKDCLRKMANLFSELFGAVSADDTYEEKQPAREMTRNASVMVRFGSSLYRAQEGINPSIESEFGFLAGQSSALLASVSISPVLPYSRGHSTVITGISPQLGLEIVPVVSGARAQSLRLVDVRFLHGIADSYAPHTISHVGKVTAVMDAKTILLIDSKRRLTASTQNENIDTKRGIRGPSTNNENNAIFMFGTVPRQTLTGAIDPSSVETDIRMQLKLGVVEEISQNQIDLRVGRIYLGCNQTLPNITNQLMSTNLHMGVNNLILRAQWNEIGCKLRLKENLISYETASAPTMLTETASFANITNSLQAESILHTKSTFQLQVDAFAALWGVPECELRIESTAIFTEVFHLTMRVQSKLMDQVRKLRNEVKRLAEPVVTRESRRKNGSYSISMENPGFDAIIPMVLTGDISAGDGTTSRTAEKDNNRNRMIPFRTEGNRIIPFSKTTVSIKGSGLKVALRGYQRHEATEKAIIRLDQYELYYKNIIGDSDIMFNRRLSANFRDLQLAYNDGERNMNNDLFRIPSPNLCLMITEKKDSVGASLSGDLEIKLGVGCFLWSKFQKIAKLTIEGVRGQKQSAGSATDTSSSETSQNWGLGRSHTVQVDLNPRVDLTGDLTLDMLTDYVNRMPHFMYTGLVIPLEKISKTLYEPLLSDKGEGERGNPMIKGNVDVRHF